MSGEYVSIPGVPETITRDRYVALAKGAGFDVKDLISLRFEANGIYAEVYAADEKGHRFTVDGKNIATHLVCVKVVEKDEAV